MFMDVKLLFVRNAMEKQASMFAEHQSFDCHNLGDL